MVPLSISYMGFSFLICNVNWMNPKTPTTLTFQKSMCWASKEFQRSRGNKTPMKCTLGGTV